MVPEVHKIFVGLSMQVMCEFNGLVFLGFLYANMNLSVDLNCLFCLGHRLTEWAGLHWKEQFPWGSGITVLLAGK